MASETGKPGRKENFLNFQRTIPCKTLALDRGQEVYLGQGTVHTDKRGETLGLGLSGRLRLHWLVSKGRKATGTSFSGQRKAPVGRLTRDCKSDNGNGRAFGTRDSDARDREQRRQGQGFTKRRQT